MKIKNGDLVKIIAGKDKGKTGKVMMVFTSSKKVVVEGINKVKKHVKPGAVSKDGGLVEVERPIDLSNVMYMDEKLGRPVKLGYKMENDKRVRINKKTGKAL